MVLLFAKLVTHRTRKGRRRGAVELRTLLGLHILAVGSAGLAVVAASSAINRQNQPLRLAFDSLMQEAT